MRFLAKLVHGQHICAEMYSCVCVCEYASAFVLLCVCMCIYVLTFIFSLLKNVYIKAYFQMSK
jgi:hypothetical protein